MKYLLSAYDVSVPVSLELSVELNFESYFSSSRSARAHNSVSAQTQALAVTSQVKILPDRSISHVYAMQKESTVLS